MAMYGSDSAFSTFGLASAVYMFSFFFSVVLGLNYEDRKQGHITLKIPEKKDYNSSQRFFLFSVRKKDSQCK